NRERSSTPEAQFDKRRNSPKYPVWSSVSVSGGRLTSIAWHWHYERWNEVPSSALLLTFSDYAFVLNGALLPYLQNHEISRGIRSNEEVSVCSHQSTNS
ncbi:hypothetical protein D918_01417, partial [Trichuris suis]